MSEYSECARPLFSISATASSRTTYLLILLLAYNGYAYYGYTCISATASSRNSFMSGAERTRLGGYGLTCACTCACAGELARITVWVSALVEMRPTEPHEASPQSRSGVPRWIHLMPYMMAAWVRVVTGDYYYCRAPSGRALGSSCSRRRLHVAARWPPPPARSALRS